MKVKRFHSLIMLALALCLCSFPVSADTTLSFTPGWDVFDVPLDYIHSNVTYSLSGTSLDVMFHLVGADPNVFHDVGIHEFLPLDYSGDCNSLTFGQFAVTPGCGFGTRQGVDGFVAAFEFGTLNTDDSGNGDFDALVTGLAPGVYNLEFTVRAGPVCPGDCDVIYQSPGPYGNTTTIAAVPEPSSVILLLTVLLGVAFVARKRIARG